MPPSRALSLSRPLIRFLVALNLAYALFVLAMLVVSLLPGSILFEALGLLPFPPEHHARIVLGLRAILLVGVLAAAVVDRLLRQLLAIVETVRTGDPFVARNAQRLEHIAWCVLAAEGLRLLIGAIAWAATNGVDSLDLDLGIGFSITPWLAVLLLFVLARVFAEGARLRADLDGTV
jgi:hypothetical protein